MSWTNNKRDWDGFSDGAKPELAGASENSKRPCTDQQQENFDSGLGTWPLGWPLVDDFVIDDWMDFSSFSADPHVLEDEIARNDISDIVSGGDEESQLDEGLFGKQTGSPKCRGEGAYRA